MNTDNSATIAVQINQQSKLDELRKQRQKRDDAREAKRRENEIQELELEAKYEKELGPRGVAWNLIDLTNLDEGFVVVKAGDTKEHKQFTAAVGRAKDKPIPDEAFVAYVVPALVYPPREAFLAIASKRHEVWARAANAIGDLQGFVQRENSGKY